MLPGVIQLFAARKAVPPLPYDAEVAYIERDCSIPWTDSGGAEVVGYYDLSRYLDSNETIGTMRPITATWSFQPVSQGVVYAVYRLNGLIGRGALKQSGYTVYCFAAQTGASSAVDGAIDVFRTQKLMYGTGALEGYVDGLLAVSQSSVSASGKLSYLQLMRTELSTNARHYDGKIRVSSVKVGSDVDLIPVVKGSAVGFYNRVDGEMFLAEQACLSAGPRV